MNRLADFMDQLQAKVIADARQGKAVSGLPAGLNFRRQANGSNIPV
jgi:hypothetical protein